MKPQEPVRFNHLYQSYVNELTLQGNSDRIIDSYGCCIRLKECRLSPCS